LMAASVTVLVMDAKDSGLVASAGTYISTLIDPLARHTPAANESRGDMRLQEAVGWPSNMNPWSMPTAAKPSRARSTSETYPRFRVDVPDVR
jgi:hypothetical protein